MQFLSNGHRRKQGTATWDAMIAKWISSSLSRKLLVGLAASLAITSFVFVLLFVGLYRTQLERERGAASAQVNRLLQVSLENAMLKRDLPGLREIVERLGRQEDIRNVMIINPSGEVRFASSEKSLGRQLAAAQLAEAPFHSSMAELPQMAWFSASNGGVDILRSVNPIRNKPICSECHGPVSQNPINGVLIVDHDAGNIRKGAMMGAAMLSGVGAAVLILTLLGSWAFMRRFVIHPIDRLMAATRSLASGDLDARTDHSGSDELARLSGTFDMMAARLQQSVGNLQESEDFLQSLIDKLPDGLRVIDEDYTVVMANDAYCRQLAADHKSVVGRPCYAAHGRDEPCPPTLITCPFHAMPDDNGPLKCIHRHVRSDGSEFHVEIMAARLETSRDGKRRSLIVEEIRDLEQRVRFSHEQRLAELGQLATGVAHEIHNPLASVRLGLHSFLKRIHEDDDDMAGARRYLKAVDGEVDKCIEVTQRLLSLSVPPSPHIQLVSFTKIVPEVVSLLIHEARKSKIELDVDLGPEDLRVLATDSELRMLTLNLIQNAFHAMPGGGRLTILGRIEGDAVKIEFADTGVGILPEDMERVYQPFFSKRADQIEGTGLGLTISKAIIERYNGTLEFRSTPGEGTTFIVTMPLADEGHAAHD